MKGFPDLPPIWLLAFILIGMGVNWIFGPGAMSNPTTQAVGQGIAGCGVAIILWAGGSFWKHSTPIEPHHTPKALITDGAYGFSRNPIYIGMVVILAGAVVYLGRPVLGVLVPLFAVVLELRFIRPEEETLKQTFGAEAEAYLAKTNRWL